MELERRSVLKGSAAIAAGTLIGTSQTWAGANDRINIAVIGLNGRGKSHIAGHQGAENVEVTTLCDVDKKVLAQRAEQFESKYDKKVKTVVDMRDGEIGEVYLARGLCFRTRASIGNKKPMFVPEHLDYNLWLGPAQYRPYTENIVHYNWHWHWDFGNGDVGNQGVHETDMCIWGLGVDTHPDQVTAMGGKFLWDDDKETPELLSTLYKYSGENKMLQFETRPWITNSEDGATVGNIFYGKDGYMVIKGYNSFETYLGNQREPGPKGRSGGDHYANFHKAVRSRNMEDQNGPVETIHYSSTIAHLGNIAYRVGEVLEFDPHNERFINNDHANYYLARRYRGEFVVPEIV